MQLSEQFGDIMSELLHAHGFQVPLYMASIGTNGVMLYARYVLAEDGAALDCEFLAEHIPAGADFGLPLNIMVVDATGQSARVLLASPERFEIVH
jgi:hypothetical protein